MSPATIWLPSGERARPIILPRDNSPSPVFRRGTIAPTGRTVIAATILAAACGEPQAERTADPHRVFPLDEIVTWGETITVEENDEVITVLPRVTPDTPDGYLVTDLRLTLIPC